MHWVEDRRFQVIAALGIALREVQQIIWGLARCWLHDSVELYKRMSWGWYLWL